MDARTRQLLEEAPLPLLIRLSTPNSTAFLITAAVSLAEVWFVGQLGSKALAAIALVFPLLMLTQTLSGGALGGAVASAIARALGAGDRQRAERLIWHALTLASAGAAVLLVTFLIIGESFLRFLGGHGDILASAMNYSMILFAGGISLWFMGVLTAVFRGTGEMKFPALLMVLSACIQVPVSGCLILGAFGLPSLGVPGAAVSAIVASLIVNVCLLQRLFSDKGTIRLSAATCVMARSAFRDILQVALPAAFSPMLTVATIISLTAIVGRFGENVLAGYGIGSRIEFLLIPMVFGIGASMTSLVGTSIGAGNYERAERIGRLGGLLAGLLAGGIGVVLALFPDVWIWRFTDDQEVFDAARSYIRIMGPCFAFQGIGLSLYFASQGAGAMFWPVLALFVRITVAVGGALLLVTHTEFGLQGVFSAAAVGMLLYGAIMIGALQMGAWRPKTGDRI